VELHRRNSASFRLHIQNCAVVVVEGATIPPFAYGATTMLALGLLLNFAGIGLFCWLIFTLAVYALPFFVGLYVFMLALHGGAGILGAPLAGIAAGGMTLAIGQMAFAMTRSAIIRAIVAVLFAVPATLAGYQVVFAMSQIGVPSLVWREIFACLGAIFIGGTAWTRLTIFTETRRLDSGREARSDPQPVLSAAAHQQ
jgi:phosphoglycerol transferase MdoB-like AlkP superfamily enzyme